jgi:hypothetical protein
MYRLLAGAIVLTALTGFATAQDKKTTAWERETNGLELTFEMGKDTLKVTVMQGDNGTVFSCKTTTDKNGVVKATVTEATEKGSFPPTPKKGFEFSFKWKEDGDKATISEFKWEGLEEAKDIVEGEYTKKK